MFLTPLLRLGIWNCWYSIGTAQSSASVILRRWAKSATLRPGLFGPLPGEEPRSQLRNPIEMLSAQRRVIQKKRARAETHARATLRRLRCLSLATEGLFSTRLTKHQP